MGLTIIGVILASLASATPITIGGTDYVRSGNSELGLSASFGPAPTAVSTATSLTYHGFVELEVSGVGQSLGTILNDAFYLFTQLFTPPNQTNDPNYYQLAVDTVPITGAPGFPTPLPQLARNTIVFDIDAGLEVTPVYVPAYQPNHRYRFVIDTGLTGGFSGGASLLHFGVANGIYADNAGSYRINVWQLEAVPEPGTLFLVALGLGALSFRARKRS
jgi:hypothetical protein